MEDGSVGNQNLWQKFWCNSHGQAIPFRQELNGARDLGSSNDVFSVYKVWQVYIKMLYLYLTILLRIILNYNWFAIRIVYLGRGSIVQGKVLLQQSETPRPRLWLWASGCTKCKSLLHPRIFLQSPPTCTCKGIKIWQLQKMPFFVQKVFWLIIHLFPNFNVWCH